MNAAIQYYILRNNVKELKKYSSAEVINQKYFMSQYPIVIIMLKKVISNVSEISDYTSSGSAREWKTSYAVHIDKFLLTICYLKREKTGIINTNTNTVKYDDEQIFNASEVSCFISVFDHIVQVKNQEKMILKEIEINNKISSLRNNLCS